MKMYLLTLLLCSCSLFRNSSLSDSENEVPSWVYSPYDSCHEDSELCATGEGKTYAEADAQAKINLASIFEVKVQSEFNAHTSSSQTVPWQSQVRQEVQASLKESVDQVLETVQIKKRFKKDHLSYAMAKLDRPRAGELLNGRLSKLDHELMTQWEHKQRTNLRRMMKIYLEREKINERYSIVSGQSRPAPLTYENIIKWRETKTSAEPLILKIGQAPEWMKEKIKELLTEAGFKLVKGEASKVLTLQVDSIKEFLNVNGFEKYTFTLNMSSIVAGEKKKVISISETVTGRSQTDALLKVKVFFNDYIEQHLADLQLD